MAAYYRGIGDRVASFSAEYIVQTKGRWAGKPFEMEPWQRDFLDELYLIDEDGQNVCWGFSATSTTPRL